MIDTIRLALDIKRIPDEFKIAKSKNGVFRGVINPTKEMKESGRYYPRITFVKRPVRGGFSQQFLIEFSIPKLIKGNNFSEVNDEDFDAIIKALKDALFDMDIKWQFSAVIANARVVKIDYSKNIVFNDGTTISQVLRLLNLANIKKTMDVSSGEFRNGGQICHLHTSGRDIAFYDKISDLKRSKISEKRSVEKDNKIQIQLLDALSKRHNLSVLRFEIRLNGVNEIKRNLVKIGEDKSDLSFRHLFSSKISQAILLNWWHEIFNQIPKAPLDDETVENMFLGLLKNEEAKPQRVLATLGMKYLMQDRNFDARFAKEVFDNRFKNGSWARSNKLLLKPEAPKNLRHLLYIEETLKEMRPIDIREYTQDFY